MAFVYRYLRPRSEEVVYVGKTSGDYLASLAARIEAHSKEEKFKKSVPESGYTIEYIDGLSAADADILETALINTYPYPPKLNERKTGWGKSGFVNVDGLSWKPWPPELEPRRKSLLMWDYPDRTESLYCCDCCGRKEMIGRSGSPRYALLNLHTAPGDFSGFLWLCDACSAEVCETLMTFFDNLRGAKQEAPHD